MFLLGLVALVQMAFLPGFLFVYGLRVCREPVRVLTCSFCLSAVLNFYLVFFCLLLGIYTAPVLYSVIAVELLSLTYVAYRRGVFDPLLDRVAANSPSTNDNGVGLRQFFNDHGILGIAALVVIAFSCFEVYQRIGSTFAIGDVINSWNRWGMEIAGNDWPQDTQLYPQLLPANFSITYVLIGDTMMWLFAKVWASCFFTVMLLSIYQLYRDERRWEIALAVPFAAWLLYSVMTDGAIYDGIADIALGTFAFQALAALLRAQPRADNAAWRRELLLASLFTVACALTKQGGLYMMAAFPLLAWMLAGAGGDAQRRRAVRKLLLYATPAILLAVLPWYLPETLEFANGARKPLVGQVTTLHEGRDLWHRICHGLELLSARTSWQEVIAMCVLLAASLTVPRYRVITLFVIVPYYFCWAIGFSYDHRNSALLLPMLALMSAVGVGAIWRQLEFGAVKVPGLTLPRVRLAAATTVAIVALIATNAKYDAPRLSAWHNQRLVDQAGVPELNHALLNYLRQNETPGQILTTYKSMRWVPPLTSRWYPTKPNRYYPLTGYVEHLKKDEVQFLLMDRLKTLPEVVQYLDAAESTGELQKEFAICRDRFVFYRKLSLPKQETAIVAEQQSATKR